MLLVSPSRLINDGDPNARKVFRRNEGGWILAPIDTPGKTRTVRHVLRRWISCIRAYQLTKLFVRDDVTFRQPRSEDKRKGYALSNAVFSVSWHDGSICRRVVLVRFGYSCVELDVSTCVLRMFDGPLAGLIGTEGDDDKG